jgi:hypothetical protein
VTVLILEKDSGQNPYSLNFETTTADSRKIRINAKTYRSKTRLIVMLNNPEIVVPTESPVAMTTKLRKTMWIATTKAMSREDNHTFGANE